MGVSDDSGLFLEKGMILNKVSMTASKYEIKEPAGNTYMFCEWKSGGISEPWYFVFKKVA